MEPVGALCEVGPDPQVSSPQFSTSSPSYFLRVAVRGAPRSSLEAREEQGWAESRPRGLSRANQPSNRTCWRRAVGGVWCGRGRRHVTLRGLLIRAALLAGVLVLCWRLCAQACRPRNREKVTAARRLSIHRSIRPSVHPSVHPPTHPFIFLSFCPSLALRLLPSRPGHPAP